MRAAMYARYSTDKQNCVSIEDQFRYCEGLAAQHGLQVVARYSDEGVSGGTVIKRDGYQSLISAVRSGGIRVVIAYDLSRLWRNQAEQAPRLAELRDMGIAVVTSDLDTRQEVSVFLAAIKGAMNEEFRKEVGRRTYRGIEGLALKGLPTGGRAYGYISAKDSLSNDREINEQEAAIVRRIFQDYADGLSAAAICAALNRERIPSPGSSWGRTSRRTTGWVVSAIGGDRKRGNGILNNELYIGHVIWNRHKWVRAESDSGRRKCVPNPREKWIEHQIERLRIVPQALWNRVKQRQAAIESTIGQRIAAGIAKSAAGARPRHLLSGLLRCGSCGASFVVSGRNSYACSSHVHGRDCDNTVRLKQHVVELALVDGIKERLLQPTVIEEARRRVVAALRKSGNGDESLKRRAETLRAEVGNLTEAIASGALRASKALAERLAATEAELDRVEAELNSTPTRAVTDLTPRIKDKLLQAVGDLPAVIRRTDPERGRAAIAAIVGEITVKTTRDEVRLESEESAVEKALLRVAGAKHTIMVAGARYVICVLTK